MKKIGLSLIVIACLLTGGSLHAGPSKASPLGIGLAVPVNIVPFGVGLGLSGKYWLNRDHAIDATLFGGSGWVSLAGDFLWHRYGVFSGEAAKRMPLYYGAGGTVTAWSAGPYSGTAMGVQGKLGVNYIFREPFDIYAEAIPVVNVTPVLGFGVGLSVGGRWYF